MTIRKRHKVVAMYHGYEREFMIACPGPGCRYCPADAPERAKAETWTAGVEHDPDKDAD